MWSVASSNATKRTISSAPAREVADRIPAGPVLFLAEGEGRNAVFLAEMGHAVTAVDLSDVGLANAARLAAERGVEITTVVADLAEYEPGEACWAGIVSIWGHLPRVVRRAPVSRRACRGCGREGPSCWSRTPPRQLERPGDGGPSSADMLMTPDDVREEFAGLRFERCLEVDRDVAEGRYHHGPSTTVQVLAFKP